MVPSGGGVKFSKSQRADWCPLDRRVQSSPASSEGAPCRDGPATHLAGHPEGISHQVLDVVGARKRPVERRRHVETEGRENAAPATLQSIRRGKIPAPDIF